MATQTFTLPAPPKILAGKALYDALMSKIEPDLVSTAIPTLAEKYSNETEVEKERRRKRYNKAYEKFYDALDTYLYDMQMRIKRYRKQGMETIEQISAFHDDQHLDNLAASFFELS